MPDEMRRHVTAGGAVEDTESRGPVRAVFVRLTGACLTAVTASPVQVPATAALRFNGLAAQRWCAVSLPLDSDGARGSPRAQVLLLGFPADGRLRRAWDRAEGEARLDVAGGLDLAGPALDGLPEFLERARSESARVLLTVLLTHGLDRFDLGRDRAIAAAVHDYLSAGSHEVTTLDTAIAMGDDVTYVEGPDAVLTPTRRLVALDGDALSPLHLAAGRLDSGRSFAFVSADGGGSPEAMVAVARDTATLRLLRAPRARSGGFEAVHARCAAAGAAVALRVRETFGAAIARQPEGAARTRLGRQLVALQRRQALPARSVDDGDLGVAARVTTALPIGDAGVFLAGRLSDAEAFVDRLVLKTPLGEATTIDKHIVHFQTPKSAQGDMPSAMHGFAGFIPLDEGARELRQVRLQLVYPGGARADLLSPLCDGDPRAARRAVLQAVPPSELDPATIEKVLHPALETLQRELLRHKTIKAQRRFGTTPKSPAVSLVIPLYREYGFIRHQLHAFTADPDFAAAEVIYVLDAPEDARQVEALLHDLHLVYGVPVRLLILGDNYGFAGATNMGALLAKGRRLVLFNSDVVPQGRGWLGRWIALHDAEPETGLTGPKLRFADGSLQHAGLYFDDGLMPWWTNHHYDKGLPADTPRARRSREVPGVTAAAAMIDRKLFRRLGGLCEGYVVGDFEDSDLCLRARAAGYRNRYIAEVELFHFERMSIRHHGDYWGTPADRYNGWLHSRKWDAAIRELMADHRPVAATPADSESTPAPAKTTTKAASAANGQAADADAPRGRPNGGDGGPDVREPSA